MVPLGLAMLFMAVLALSTLPSGTDPRCDDCDAPLPMRHPYHALCLAEEQRTAIGIEVLAESTLVTWCEHCAAQRDVKRGLEVFSTARERYVSLHELEHEGADACRQCGIGVDGQPYFSVLHERETSRGDEIQVHDARCALLLCRECRREYDFSRIRFR